MARAELEKGAAQCLEMQLCNDEQQWLIERQDESKNRQQKERRHARNALRAQRLEHQLVCFQQSLCF